LTLFPKGGFGLLRALLHILKLVQFQPCTEFGILKIQILPSIFLMIMVIGVMSINMVIHIQVINCHERAALFTDGPE
jgi:hypothetical protein